MNALQVIKLLEDTLQEPSRIPAAISALQRRAWKEQLSEGPAEEILGDLAYDLDFYEPNPTARAQDPSFLSEDQVLAEIKAALDKLRGIEIA